MAEIKRYEEMKDSGFEWIGTIPKEWQLSKVKRLFSIGRGRVIATTELKQEGYPVYSSQTKNNGILGYIDTYDFDKNQLTWTTDGANAGTVFLRKGKHNCTNVCGTLMPKDETNDLRYLYYTLSFIAFYHKRADINGFKIMNNEMAEIEMILPPLSTQKAIADYLDTRCSQIDEIIEEAKKSIEDYKALKAAVIQEAVTKGLDPDVKMKDSGIEWIGEIPCECEVIRIKQFSYLKGRIGWQALTSDEFIYEGPYCVTGTDFINGKINWDTCYHVSQERYEMDSNIHIHIGDLLITKDGTIGKLAIVDFLPDKACLNSHLLIIRPLKNKYINRFLYWVLSSDMFKHYYSLVSNGSIMQSISQKSLGEFAFPVWTIKKQYEIADYLDRQCGHLDNIISQKETLIADLEKYKKSLIYEVVTGKRKVT